MASQRGGRQKGQHRGRRLGHSRGEGRRRRRPAELAKLGFPQDEIRRIDRAIAVGVPLSARGACGDAQALLPREKVGAVDVAVGVAVRGRRRRGVPRQAKDGAVVVEEIPQILA
jgi:hypothetical protein